MKIKEIVDCKIKEGDYFSHDDPEYNDWHKFARLQDLYDFVDDGDNYDKEEVEAEIKWLRKELDMHASERRGVSADTYKKGWTPHGHNVRVENINEELPPHLAKYFNKDEECGEGEYYCRKSGMCKPIPDDYTVTNDGTLIKDVTPKGYGIDEEFQPGFKVGDKVKKSGFPGVITKVHSDVRKGMVDVKLKRGTVTVDVKSVTKEDVNVVNELAGFLASGTYIFAIDGIIKAKGRLDQVKKAKDIEVKNTSKAKQKEIHDAPGGTHSYTIGLLSNKKASATQDRATRSETMLVDSPDDVKIGDKFDTTKDYRTKDSLPEVATAGSTSAGNIAAVNNPHVTNPYLKKGKKKHSKPVSVSALDDKTSSIFGGPLKRP